MMTTFLLFLFLFSGLPSLMANEHHLRRLDWSGDAYDAIFFLQSKLGQMLFSGVTDAREESVKMYLDKAKKAIDGFVGSAAVEEVQRYQPLLGEIRQALEETSIFFHGGDLTSAEHWADVAYDKMGKLLTIKSNHNA